MQKFLVALIAVTALFGCATPEQIAARIQQQEQEDFNTCTSYGFRPNSDSFRNCMLQLDIAREQRERIDYNNAYPRFHYGFHHYR